MLYTSSPPATERNIQLLPKKKARYQPLQIQPISIMLPRGVELIQSFQHHTSLLWIFRRGDQWHQRVVYFLAQPSTYILYRKKSKKEKTKGAETSKIRRSNAGLREEIFVLDIFVERQ